MGVFLVFIAEYPYARFFFGVPAWAIGAVIVGIQVLQYLGYDETERLIVLFVTIAVAALTARSMGLAQSLPWIPKIPFPSGIGGSRSKRKRRAPRSSGGGAVIDGPWGDVVAQRTARRRSRCRQPPRPVDDIDDQVELDHLLDKISGQRHGRAHGQDEKRRLNELAKRLRNRK